jgi:hypothetical protein
MSILEKTFLTVSQARRQIAYLRLRGATPDNLLEELETICKDLEESARALENSVRILEESSSALEKSTVNLSEIVEQIQRR